MVSTEGPGAPAPNGGSAAGPSVRRAREILDVPGPPFDLRTSSAFAPPAAPPTAY